MDLSLCASSLPSVLCARASSSPLALNDYLCLGASLTEAHALNLNLFPHLQYLSSASNYISPVLRRWRFSCSQLNASPPSPSSKQSGAQLLSASLHVPLTNTSLCFSSPSGLSCSDQDCKHTLKSLFYL